MIPGYIINYKDSNGYIHLYFFPGIDDENKPIYRDIDLSSIKMKYHIIKHIDNSVDYKFYNKNIIKLYCKLVDYNNKEHIETLFIN